LYLYLRSDYLIHLCWDECLLRRVKCLLGLLIAGRDDCGRLKMQNVKMTDHRNCKGWKTENDRHENAAHEIAEHENAGLKNAVHENRWHETIIYLLWSYRVLVRNVVIWCSTLCWFCNVFLVYSLRLPGYNELNARYRATRPGTALIVDLHSAVGGRFFIVPHAPTRYALTPSSCVTRNLSFVFQVIFFAEG